jgi:hypothetical protein
MIADISILIGSCDSYADLWRPCVTLLERHWPDCPFPIYLGTDFKTFDHPRVVSLPVGHGLPWGASFRKQIEAVPTPNVLYFVADFFLRRPVESDKVRKCVRLFHEMDAMYLRLSRPSDVHPLYESTLVGSLPVGVPYRLSCNPALWKKSLLLDLLRDDDTIWSFEMIGSLRSNRYATGFYSVFADVLYFGQNVVERGKWLPWEARRFGAMDIGCDFAARATMPPGEAARWLIRRFTGHAATKLPWEVQWKLRHLLGRDGHERALHGSEALTSRSGPRHQESAASNGNAPKVVPS